MANTTAQRFPFRVFLTLGLTVIASAQTPPVTTEFVMGNFPAAGVNLYGSNPQAGVIGDGAGNLYGTTSYGGAVNYGVAFKVNAGGETVLHSFSGGVDGKLPSGNLIRDGAGYLYGTCAGGGRLEKGVAFRLNQDGQETILHSFTGSPDGWDPQGGMIGDGAGNLYGTTYSGGETNNGTVFKLDATGQETILYSFKPLPDGAGPTTGLIRDGAGNFYGLTYGGGSSERGVIFKLDATGKETVLHSFTGGTDGGHPNALVGSESLNLYGTTQEGGSMGAGVVFKLDSAGTFKVLYSFTGGADGGYPTAGLIRDPVGNLYGSTSHDGDANAGVVFRIDPAGQETVLYSFTGGDDGRQPAGPLSLDAAGNLYGTTYSGGKYGGGVIFKLTPVAAAP